MTSPKSEMTSRERDAALLDRWRAGGMEACTELLRIYRDRAVNLAYGVLRNRADAEDAAQQAFIRVFTTLSDFRGESAFFSWLYRIVISISIDMTRKASTTEVAFEPELHGNTDCCGNERRLEVDAALNSLPVHLRSILVLREIDELSYEEIAEILGIPVGTVRSRLSSAREAFRRKYKEMLDDEV